MSCTSWTFTSSTASHSVNVSQKEKKEIPYGNITDIIYIWLNFENGKYINLVCSALSVCASVCVWLNDSISLRALINKSQVHK